MFHFLLQGLGEMKCKQIGSEKVNGGDRNITSWVFRTAI